MFPKGQKTILKMFAGYLIVYYNSRQWQTVVYWVLDTPKCFETRRKSLKTRSEARWFGYFLECVKIFRIVKNSMDHGYGYCLLFLEHGTLKRGLSNFRPGQLTNRIAGNCLRYSWGEWKGPAKFTEISRSQNHLVKIVSISIFIFRLKNQRLPRLGLLKARRSKGRFHL